MATNEERSAQAQEKLKQAKDMVNAGSTWKEAAGRLGISYGRLLKVRDKYPDNRHLEQVAQVEGFPANQCSHMWIKTESGTYFVNNKTAEAIDYEDIREDLIKDIKKHSPKYPTIKRKKVTDPHLLILDIADAHFGKLAEHEETGETYNLGVARARCIEGTEAILSKTSGFPIEQIIFPIGNDILHIDTPKRTTTSGTPQDTVDSWHKAFKVARATYVECIERLLTIAPVHLQYCPSNHDYMSGYMLADSLASWFRNAKDLTADTRIIHRKYYQYGENLIGHTHGDGAKMNDLPLLMAQEAKELWGKTTYRYIYTGHFHAKNKTQWKSEMDYQGATVEVTRSPSGTDGWHHRNGYTGHTHAVEGYVHHKEKGQVCRLTHPFK